VVLELALDRFGGPAGEQEEQEDTADPVG